MKHSKYVPIADLPLNGIPVTEDVEKTYLNSYGYHCKDFSRRSLNVLSLGCSWTEGGESTSSFPSFACEYFASHFGGIEVSNWNMGLGGRGCDYMSRTLMCTVDLLKPDIVLLCFPGVDRREFFRNDGRRIKYTVDWMAEEKRNGWHWQRLSMVDRELVKHMNNLVSPYDDSVNFLKNYKLLEYTLNSRSIMWAFSMVPPDYVVLPIQELMKLGWISQDNYLGTPFNLIDQASPTDPHPGPLSNRAFGEKFAQWILTRHGQKLNQILAQRRAPLEAGQVPSSS